ncbi:MAG: O-antigen ligase family protein, partial [Flavobacteriales bacterium]
VNIGISIIQLFSSIRPDSAFTSELATYSSEHFVRFVPTGLFGNPNHFALYVCVQIFLLYTFRRYTVYTTRMVLYALSTLLVMLTHSRISEIAMVVLMLTMIIENRHWLAIQWSRFAGKLIIASVFTAAVVLSHTWVNTRERELITERNNNLVNDAEATSEGSRIALLHCGYEMLTESGYAGIGAGQFQHAMRERNWQSRTGGMVDPHCGILEIAAESGLTVAIAWIVALLLFVASSFKKKYALQSIAWMLMVAVLQFANSTFVSTPIAWCLLAWPILMYFEHENS